MTDNKVLAIDKSADTTAAAALSTAAASSTLTTAVASVASKATSKTVGEKSTNSDIIQVVSKEKESVDQSAAVSMKGSILGKGTPSIGSCDVDDITPPTGMVSFSNNASPGLTPAESTRSKTAAQQPRVEAEEYVQGLGSPKTDEQQEDNSLLSSSNPAKSGLPSMSTRSKTATAVQKMTDSQLAAEMAGGVGEQIAIERDTHSTHTHWANSVAADLNAGVSGMNHAILQDDSEAHVPYGAKAIAAAANATVSGSGVGKLSEYELLRLRKIQRNNARLDFLGLSKPVGAQLNDNSKSNNSKKKRKKDSTSTSNNSKKKRKKDSTSVPVVPPRQSNRFRSQTSTYTQEESCAFIRKEAAKGNRVKVQPDDGILSREQIQTMDGVLEGGNDTVEGEINVKKSDNKDTSSTKLSLKEQAKARSEEVDAMLKTEFNENWEAFAKHYEKEETAIEDTMPDRYKVKVNSKFTYEYSPAEVASLDEKEDIDKLGWNQCRGLLSVVGLSVKGQTLDELRERIKEFKRTGGGKAGYRLPDSSEFRKNSTTNLHRLDKVNPLQSLFGASNRDKCRFVKSSTSRIVISPNPRHVDDQSNLQLLAAKIGSGGGLNGTVSQLMSWFQNNSGLVIYPPSHPFLQKSRVETSSYENEVLTLVHPDIHFGYTPNPNAASMRKWL